MRRNPYRVSKERGVLECAELMARSGVDTLLVTDGNEKYLGVLPIRNIRLYGRTVDSIVPDQMEQPQPEKADEPEKKTEKRKKKRRD